MRSSCRGPPSLGSAPAAFLDRSNRSIAASPTCRSMAGRASNVGQFVRTSRPTCLAEYPYDSSTVRTDRAAVIVESVTRICLVLLAPPSNHLLVTDKEG